jgi:cobalt/nickel transport system ATP-binding protein
MDPIIELESIYFHYGNEPIPVLNELSFSMHKGDRVALTGANGSGKTTLLHVIMGLWKPQKGMVKIFGSQRNSRRDFLGVRRRIGLLFQDSEDQLFSLTVAEDIAFGPFNLGKNRQEV